MGCSNGFNHRVEVAVLVARGVDGTRPRRADPQAGRALGRAAGHQRGLEGDELSRTEAGHRPAGPSTGDPGRVGRVDHVVGVVAVGHPQGDATRGVGSDVVGHRPGRPLGGQHHVDAEAAAPLRDTDQRAEELGQLGGQRGELVHHDHQPGQGIAARLGGSGPECGQVLGTHRPQALLAMAQFGLEAHQGTLGQAVIEVGDHAGHMGHLRAAVEGGSALVVDEDESQMVGIRGQGQAGHHRPQQLGLARTGRAPHEQVRTVGHQVEHQGSLRGRSDGHLQVVRAPGRGPSTLHRLRGRLAAEEVQQRHRVGEAGTGRSQLGVVQPGQTGRGMGGGRGGDAPGHQRCRHRRGSGIHQPQPAGVVVDVHDGGAARREVADVAGDHDPGALRVAEHHPARRRAARERLRAVDDGQQCPLGGTGGCRLRGRRGGTGLGGHQRSGFAPDVDGVGKPAQPRPFPGEPGHQARYGQVGRAVKHRGLQDEAAGHGPGG